MPTTPASLDTIFCAAIDIESAERRADYLAGACGDDAELRRHVEKLIAAHFQAGDFLEWPAIAGSADQTADWRTAGSVDRPGAVIGSFKLLEQIGEGGMGVVYMAEQVQPVRRKVALKIIKPGMDTKQVIARFEAERQALAMMEHPNIARVLDAGATEGGRPFFVMELVRGVPITEYSDEHRLSIPQRLDLFVLVCQAVQHAHQKGIIHRDIKPSNVLITLHDGVPVPKVIDFGIAKATGLSLTDKTLFTGFAQLVGTPLYMSPEQAELSGIDVDTRSDIYSLGVLLYELLSGTTPFDPDTLRTAALDEVRRIIRDQEPPTPSTRLGALGDTQTTVSANRGTDPRKLGRSLRGELDWIVMKALEKDRRRRYETASAFAADVLRYRNDEPVEACPPSTWYRLKKSVRRHRVALVTSVMVAASLLAGTGVAIWQAIRANRAVVTERQSRQASQKREAETDALLEFVDHNILGLTLGRDAIERTRLGNNISLRQAIEAAIPDVDKRFAQQPLIKARLRSIFCAFYLTLGEPRLALPQIEEANALFSKHLGRDDPKILWTLHCLAETYFVLGRRSEAFRLHEEALALAIRRLGADHLDTLTQMRILAMRYAQANRHADALALREKSLALHRAKLGSRDPQTLESADDLAETFGALGRNAEMIKLLEDTLAIERATLPRSSTLTPLTMTNLANGYADSGRYAEALKLHEDSVPLFNIAFGADHPDTIGVSEHVVSLYESRGRHSDALALREGVFARLKAKLGPNDPKTIEAMSRVAQSLASLKRGTDALKIMDETIKRAEDRRATDPVSLYNQACLNAIAATIVRAADDSPEHDAVARAKADHAMALLSKAVSSGWRNVAHMKRDPDLGALRDRSEFKELIAGLESDARMKQPTQRP